MDDQQRTPATPATPDTAVVPHVRLVHTVPAKSPATPPFGSNARPSLTSAAALPASPTESNAPNAPIGCPRCEDMGFMVRDDGTLVRCPCKVPEDRERQRRKAVTASNLTAAMAGQTFETFNRKRAPREYDALLAFATDPQGWIALTGSVGCGKTHLLAAVAHELLAHGRAPLYVVAPDFLGYLRKGMHAESGLDVETRIEQAITADVLLLDDLGTEHETGWTQEQFYRVIDGRYRQHAPTVITTNLWFDDLPDRIASRIQDSRLVQQFAMTGSDYRRELRQNEAR